MIVEERSLHSASLRSAPVGTTDKAAVNGWTQILGHLKSFGRDPASFGLEGRKRHGAEMVMLYPMYRMPELDRQIETLRRFKQVAAGP